MIQVSSSNDVKVVVKSNGGEDGQSGAFPEGEEREVTLRRASSATNQVTARMESGDVGYIRCVQYKRLFFTHRPVSKFDRVGPYQMTDEHTFFVPNDPTHQTEGVQRARRAESRGGGERAQREGRDVVRAGSAG